MSADPKKVQLSPLVIKHSKSGAVAQVYAFGASVTSFVTASGRELLFCTRKAKLDGSKAIRGGIPLVFPQFGQPDKEMPSHGFLRINDWQVSEGNTYDNDEAAGMELILKLDDVEKGREGKWKDLDCTVKMNIKVEPEQLTSVLTFVNTGSAEFCYSALYHTYLMIQNGEADEAEKCNVIGLEGYECVDNMNGKKKSTQGPEPVAVQGETERVFTPPPSKEALEVSVSTGNGTKVRVKGFSEGIPTSCVVWNPHNSEKAKAMSDFDETQYVDMLCVEPGLISTENKLAPGTESSFTQILIAE